MTVARAATAAIAGRASGPRLALPGAVLLVAGAALLYWGLGIFRGEGSSAPVTRRMVSGAFTHLKDDAANVQSPRAGRSRFGIE